MDGLEGRGGASAVLAGAVWLDVHPTSPHRCHGTRNPGLGPVGPHLRTLGRAPPPLRVPASPGRDRGPRCLGAGAAPTHRSPPIPPLPPGSTQPPSPPRTTGAPGRG